MQYYVDILMYYMPIARITFGLNPLSVFSTSVDTTFSRDATFQGANSARRNQRHLLLKLDPILKGATSFACAGHYI